jgi:hypothetical protein
MEPIVQTLTVNARDVRRGDVFERHGKTRTARRDACREGQFTIRIETEDCGAVYVSQDAQITVTRRVLRRPCATA